MFAWNLLLGAEDELLECLLEVVVEGDVDHRVDHSVGVSEHVEPELVLLKHPGQLTIHYNIVHICKEYCIWSMTRGGIYCEK